MRIEVVVVVRVIRLIVRTKGRIHVIVIIVVRLRIAKTITR